MSVSVPPHARQGLLSRVLDNDDLLPTLRKAVLIVQGTEDAVVKPIVVEMQMARIPRAQVRTLPKGGHGCFWVDPPAFNARVREFVSALSDDSAQNTESPWRSAIISRSWPWRRNRRPTS